MQKQNPTTLSCYAWQGIHKNPQTWFCSIVNQLCLIYCILEGKSRPKLTDYVTISHIKNMYQLCQQKRSSQTSDKKFTSKPGQSYKTFKPPKVWWILHPVSFLQVLHIFIEAIDLASEGAINLSIIYYLQRMYISCKGSIFNCKWTLTLWICQLMDAWEERPPTSQQSSEGRNNSLHILFAQDIPILTNWLPYLHMWAIISANICI